MACSSCRKKKAAPATAAARTAAPILSVHVGGVEKFRTRSKEEAERKKRHYERLGNKNVVIK